MKLAQQSKLIWMLATERQRFVFEVPEPTLSCEGNRATKLDSQNLRLGRLAPDGLRQLPCSLKP